MSPDDVVPETRQAGTYVGAEGRLLAQAHLRDVEQQFRLSIAAKHQPRDQHGDDQTEEMPDETTR